MAQRRKADGVVDGYTALRAAQRATSSAPRKKAPSGTGSPSGEPERESATRIGHTARPTRHEIVCYECGYSFVLTGRIQNAYCPKCRSILETREHIINHEWSGAVKTIGTVVIGEGGVVKGGTVVAHDVHLRGKIEGGRLEIAGCLEVQSGGSFKPEAVHASDLTVRGGANLSFAEELRFRNIDIAGALNARIVASGLLTIRAGGLLRGELSGRHLAVEEGGGLEATVNVTPEGG